MDFHGINTVGKIWLERINSKPVFDANWVGRIIFALDNQTLSIGTSGGWVDIASATAGGITNPSIPVNAILLFESNVALAGYALLTDIDDEIVYITKGPGGDNGDGGTSFGTWTQDPHIHAIKHTISVDEMPQHTHPPQSGFANFMSTTGSSVGEGGDSYGTFQNTGSTGGGQQMGGGGGFPSEETSPPSTWRPKGRNWTRQQKN